MQRYRCRHCPDVIVNGEDNIRVHLSEVHSINAEFTLHYVEVILEQPDDQEEEERGPLSEAASKAEGELRRTEVIFVALILH